MPYFKPTIDFNMLQYIISSDLSAQVSKLFNDLLASLLVDCNNLMILERSKHILHAIFFYSACHFL